MVNILRNRFIQQPQSTPQIDWSQPISRGLLTTCLPMSALAQGWSLASGTLGISAASQGMAFNGTMRLVGPQLNTPNDFTILVIGTTASTLSGLKVAVSSGNMWMGCNGSNFYVSNSGTDTLAGAAAVLTTFSLVAVRSGSNYTGWLNGIKGSTSANVPTSSTALTVMDYSSGGFNWPGTISLVLAWTRSLSDSEVLSISSNPWQLYKAPSKRWLNSLGGTQTYSYTASGGITISGTGPIVKGAIKAPTGGLILLGTANPARGAARTTTGGLTFSGTATPLRSLVRAATGGILFSGAASLSFFSAVQSLTVVASGGILIRGTAAMVRGVVKTVTGGIIFGGSASITLTPDPSPTTKHNFKRGRRPRTRPNY